MHSPRRLTRPLRRTAPKTADDPRWVEISWDEALAEIAGRFDVIRRESGPESVAFSVTSPSGTPISDGIDWVERFIRLFGSPNISYATEICNWHKDHAHAFTFGCGIPTADYANADLALLWGHNPARVWLAQSAAIAQARARGAQVAVVDPRSAGSGAQADLWLRVRPGLTVRWRSAWPTGSSRLAVSMTSSSGGGATPRCWCGRTPAASCAALI